MRLSKQHICLQAVIESQAMFIPLIFKNSSSIFLSKGIVGVSITKYILWEIQIRHVKLTVRETLLLETFLDGWGLKCRFLSSKRSRSIKTCPSNHLPTSCPLLLSRCSEKTLHSGRMLLKHDELITRACVNSLTSAIIYAVTQTRNLGPSSPPPSLLLLPFNQFPSPVNATSSFLSPNYLHSQRSHSMTPCLD